MHVLGMALHTTVYCCLRCVSVSMLSSTTELYTPDG